MHTLEICTIKAINQLMQDFSITSQYHLNFHLYIFITQLIVSAIVEIIFFFEKHSMNTDAQNARALTRVEWFHHKEPNQLSYAYFTSWN